MLANHVLAAQITGGGYVSVVKVVPPLLLLFLWAKLLTWADKDAPIAHLPQVPLNIGNMCGLVVGFLLFFVVPTYYIALPLLVLIFGAEIGTYLVIRAKTVGLADLQDEMKDLLAGKFGKKKEVTAVAGQVTLINKAGQNIAVPESESPDRAAYDAVQLAMTDPLKKNADQIDLDGRDPSGTLVRYVVDGMPYSGQSIDRASGAGAISYLKSIAALDVEDRRKPQTGNMRILIDGNKHDVRVQTAGSTAGEYMRLELDPKKRNDFQLDQLGFSERQLAVIKGSIAENMGLVILSAPKGMGLTSLEYGMLRGHDAFLLHIQTIERDPKQELEGITQNNLPGKASPAEEYKMADWVISQEPDVILINRIDDSRTAVDLIKYARTSHKRVYVAMRAGSTFEALEQWRKLVGDDNLATEQLKMIINGRVLRKLCTACKVGYSPDATTLRKLGMNPEKITQLFQARVEPLRDPKGNPIPCQFCFDLRFKGRTGVFEIMNVDEEMRDAITNGKPVEPVFRKQRGRYLQEEALALVESGDTSVQEVKQVMRPGSARESVAESPPPGVAPPHAGAKSPSARPAAPAVVRKP